MVSCYNKQKSVNSPYKCISHVENKLNASPPQQETNNLTPPQFDLPHPQLDHGSSNDIT